jgi:hypothetical protein
MGAVDEKNRSKKSHASVHVSDGVTDVVMSSLKTCKMNWGSRWEGRGRVESKGWGSRSPTRDECGWTFAPLSHKRGFPSK